MERLIVHKVQPGLPLHQSETKIPCHFLKHSQIVPRLVGVREEEVRF